MKKLLLAPVLMLTLSACTFLEDQRPIASCARAIDDCAKPRSDADKLVYAGTTAEAEASIKALDLEIGAAQRSCTTKAQAKSLAEDCDALADLVEAN